MTQSLRPDQTLGPANGAPCRLFVEMTCRGRKVRPASMMQFMEDALSNPDTTGPAKASVFLCWHGGVGPAW